MKRLRSYGEDLDDVTGKDWERREIDSDRSSSRRRFYMKSESLRRSSSSLYDRSIDDDREALRPPRKRFEHDVEGFDRRKIFDRYRDGGGGGGVDRVMHVPSPRGPYGSERMNRSESFSTIRRDFPKGFRSERDRSRREGCGGLSWRRLSCGKEAADEEKGSPARDSEDRGKTRSRDSSSGEQAKGVESVKAVLEKVRSESCSSSEMEEGELEPDPIPEPSIDTRALAERDSQNFNDKEDAIKNVSKTSSENKDMQLSVKRSDSIDRTSCGERSMEMEMTKITINDSLQEEQIEIAKKVDEEIRREGGVFELKGQRESSAVRQGQEKDLAEDTCKVEVLEDTSCGEKEDLTEDTCKEEKFEDTSCREKKEIISSESSYLPSQFPNFEMKNQLEEPVVKYDELANIHTSSLEGNLEEMVREVHFSGVEVDERIEEKCINLGASQRKDKGLDQGGFEAEHRKGKGIDIQAATVGEAGYFNSVKEIKSENNSTLKPMAENPRDKGKNIAHSLSNMADSAEDEEAVEGPSRRGFELVFQDHIIQSEKSSSCGLFGGRNKNEKLKLEPLDLSLGLPGVLPDQSSKPSNSYPNSPGRTKSIHSFPSSFRTISDGFTNSISFSNSQPFVHNPSCSLTQNSMDNFEQSVGSRPIFQGIDQVVSSGSIRKSQTSIDPKRKGGAGALFHRVLINGNHSQNSIPAMNGHHNFNSSTLLRQPSFPRQPSPSQSAGSHDTLSEHSKDKMVLTKERSFNSLSRSEQLEGEKIVVNALSVVERIITRIVSEPLQVMDRMLQDMSEHSMEYLKDSICKMLANTDKRGQIRALQVTLQRRSDLTAESMTRCPPTLLEILVALKTGLPEFLQRTNNVLLSDLVEIFHNLKCRNIACRNILPVDDCDCKICSQKSGFCSACMCLICSKFDMASNTCSWVGCDVCLHWCHTDCGLRGSHIRNGRSSSVAPGATEMQFHCVACGHPSEMFGFVKEVFKMCSKDWKIENLAKELQYVRRIFCASNDIRGKSLYQVTGQMLVKLEDKKKHSEVTKNIMSFLSESESTINSNAPPYSSTEPSGNSDPRGNDVAFPNEETAWLTPLTSSKAPRLQHKGASPTAIDDDQIRGQRKDSSILPINFEKKPVVDELESVVGFKQAEAKLYQERADNARREADGLKRIAAAKNGKIDDEYSTKIAKLQLQEAEERRRQKLEELQDLERAHHDFVNLKTRMEAEIKDLLLKMEAARRNFNA